jgi:hypothetical protein
VFSARKYRSSENEPASQETVGYIPMQDRYIDGSSQPVQQEVTGYVINIEQVNATRVQPAETQILRKIRM